MILIIAVIVPETNIDRISCIVAQISDVAIPVGSGCTGEHRCGGHKRGVGGRSGHINREMFNPIASLDKEREYCMVCWDKGWGNQPVVRIQCSCEPRAGDVCITALVTGKRCIIHRERHPIVTIVIHIYGLPTWRQGVFKIFHYGQCCRKIAIVSITNECYLVFDCPISNCQGCSIRSCYRWVEAYIESVGGKDIALGRQGDGRRKCDSICGHFKMEG